MFIRTASDCGNIKRVESSWGIVETKNNGDVWIFPKSYYGRVNGDLRQPFSVSQKVNVSNIRRSNYNMGNQKSFRLYAADVWTEKENYAYKVECVVDEVRDEFVYLRYRNDFVYMHCSALIDKVGLEFLSDILREGDKITVTIVPHILNQNCRWRALANSASLPPMSLMSGFCSCIVVRIGSNGNFGFLWSKPLSFIYFDSNSLLINNHGLTSNLSQCITVGDRVVCKTCQQVTRNNCSYRAFDVEIKNDLKLSWPVINTVKSTINHDEVKQHVVKNIDDICLQPLQTNPLDICDRREFCDGNGHAASMCPSPVRSEDLACVKDDDDDGNDSRNLTLEALSALNMLRIKDKVVDAADLQIFPSSTLMPFKSLDMLPSSTWTVNTNAGNDEGRFLIIQNFLHTILADNEIWKIVNEKYKDAFDACREIAFYSNKRAS